MPSSSSIPATDAGSYPHGAAARLGTVLVLLALLTTALRPPLTVASGNPPVASDQSAATREARDLPIFLLATDDEFDALAFAITDPPDNGTLDDCSTGACTYTPNTGTPNFVGTDSFMWTANDGTSASNEATFTITVSANTAPVAFDGSDSTSGQAITIVLFASDDTVDPLSYAIVTPPSNGVLSGSSCGGLDGNFCTYTPNTGFVGTDTFTFTATDDLGAVSNLATVTIDVSANAAPVAANQSAIALTDTPSALTLDATDADFDSLSYTIVDPPDHGTLDDCSSGSCTYTPAAGYVGPDSFRWLASDGIDDSNEATFSITVSDPLGRVLVLEPTVTGGASSPEASAATALGYAVDVVDETTWAAMTAAQFDAYAAIVLGDPTCGSISAIAAAEANRATWSSVVDGNVLIIGTDPTFHEFQGGGQLTDSGMAYVLASTGKTGLFAGLSCYYDGVDDNTPVDLLDQFGTFEVGHADCFNDAHIVADHPALAGLDDEDLSNWSCSVHEVFQEWPLSFVVLAIAESFGAVYTAPDGTVGSPYLLASGDITVRSDIDLTPLTATNPVGTPHELTGEVSNTSGPIVGTTVTFAVIDGPHTGTTGTDVTDGTGTATFSYTGTTVGTDTIKATFTDSESRTQTSNLVTKTWEDTDNTPPTPDAGGPYLGNEGSAVTLNGAVTDPDPGDPVTTTWTYAPAAGVDAGATCSFGSASAVDTTISCTDDGTFTLTLTANDGTNSDVIDTATLTLANVEPTVEITTPAGTPVFGVGRTVDLSAAIGDAGANDTHTCSIDWGDGTSGTGSVTTGVCSGAHAYAAIGVYTITVTVTDDDGATGTDDIMVVVSDRTTKVTGGGFVVDGGRTSFGFVAKEDAAGLHGQIQVRAPGDDRFHGSSVTTLTSTATSATWTGAGRWNGVEGYTFEVSVVDNRAGGKKKVATADTISIVIRDGGGTVVFEASGPLMGGNITVH